MLPCDKRQTIVDREKDETTHRCKNSESEAYRSAVNEDICSVCPVRHLVNRVRPCAQKPTILKDCEECKPIDDKVLEKALTNIGGFDEEILPEEDPTGAVPEFPAMSVQLWLYKQALQKWHAAGRPVRTKEEVEDILENKCKPCPWYDAEKSRCKGCGCRVSNGGFPALNKIKMATEHCPHPEEKW
jgi:hypothetical protein